MDNRIIQEDSSTLDLEKDSKLSRKFDFTKLLTKKNIKILILIVIAIVGLIIIFGMDSSDTNANVTTSSAVSGGYRTTLEYCEQLENKLTSVLASVKGAGQVSVMITVDGSPELVYAKDVDEKISSNSSGTTTTSNSSSPIIVNVDGNSNALILTENLPQVKGVIVVSTGADDVGVKLDILNAVSTLLDISIDKVSVLKGI